MDKGGVKPVDDDDAKHILLNIRRTLMNEYPLINDAGRSIDLRYVQGIGHIVNICIEVLQAVQQDRKVVWPTPYLTEK